MSNLSLGFYSINGVNFSSAIPKRDCNNRTNHRSTYVNWLTSKYGTQPLKGHKNEIKSHKNVCTDSEEDDDRALKTNLQEKNEAMNWSCSNVQYALLNEYAWEKKINWLRMFFYCTQTMMMVKAEKKDKKKKNLSFSSVKLK